MSLGSNRHVMYIRGGSKRIRKHWPDIDGDPSWVNIQQRLVCQWVYPHQALEGKFHLQCYRAPARQQYMKDEIIKLLFLHLTKTKEQIKAIGFALTAIENKLFSSALAFRWRTLRNRFPSFCWLMPPLRATSTCPFSSTNLSKRDSFMISTTSCNPRMKSAW